MSNIAIHRVEDTTVQILPIFEEFGKRFKESRQRAIELFEKSVEGRGARLRNEELRLTPRRAASAWRGFPGIGREIGRGPEQVVTCLCCLLAMTVTGSAADPWSQLGSLSQDARIAVETQAGEHVTGFAVRLEPDRLVLRRTAGDDRSVDRASVKRVTRKSRGRGALIGLIVGFGGGFAMGAAAGPYIADFGNPGAARRVKYGLGWGAFTGGIGAGAGALIGSKKTIYP